MQDGALADWTGAQVGAVSDLLKLPEKISVIDGILDLSQAPRARPRFYDDPVYKIFSANAATQHALHYRSGSLSGWIEAQIKADLARLIGTRAPPIFDLGCGIGAGFAQFGGAENIVGVDSDLALLRLAKHRYPQATLICAPLEHLPFKAGSLNTVISNEVIEHIFHLEAVLESVADCLAPEGVFYVLVPTEGGLAIKAAQMVTSRRNAKIHGITAKQSRHAQRIEHCNTIFAIENALRKHFRTEQTSLWPFRIGGNGLNLAKSYKLRRLSEIAVDHKV